MTSGLDTFFTGAGGTYQNGLRAVLLARALCERRTRLVGRLRWSVADAGG